MTPNGSSGDRRDGNHATYLNHRPPGTLSGTMDLQDRGADVIGRLLCSAAKPDNRLRAELARGQNTKIGSGEARGQQVPEGLLLSLLAKTACHSMMSRTKTRITTPFRTNSHGSSLSPEERPRQGA